MFLCVTFGQSANKSWMVVVSAKAKAKVAIRDGKVHYRSFSSIRQVSDLYAQKPVASWVARSLAIAATVHGHCKLRMRSQKFVSHPVTVR
jgi:hypothetical protein